MESGVRSRTIGADIRIDPTTGALVVLVIREAKAVDSATGRVLKSETAQSFKRIPTKVTEHTDVPRLADEIIEKFGAIVSASRRQELLECLNGLRRVAMGLTPDPRVVFRHQHAAAAAAATAASSPSPSRSPAAASAHASATGPARLDGLQDYIEMLYDDGERKLIGARRIMDLARVNENLEELAKDKLLLGLLARVLREDASKSIDLASAVVSTVVCFSNFALFREVLMQQSLHEACLAVVQTELRRRAAWEKDLKRGDGDPSAAEAEIKRYKRMRAKQDELIALALHVLMNICGDPTENPAVSQALIEKGLLGALVRCLSNEGDYSLLIVTTFLKNLSVFGEVVSTLSREEIVGRLVPQLESSASPQLKEITLRLLSNLSLDVTMQKQLVSSGSVPKIVALLANMDLQPIALKTLLPISSMPEHRPVFANDTPPQIGPILYQLLAKWPGERVGDVVMRISTNLVQIEDIALQIVGGADGFGVLLERASRTLDPALFRMLRAVAAHRSCRKLFESHADELASLASRAKSKELAADVLGILSNLTTGVDWHSIFEKYSFADFLAKAIGQDSESMAIEAISLLGAAVASREVAVLAARESLAAETVAFLERLRQRHQQQDNEAAAARVCFTAYRLLLFKDSRKVFLTPRFVSALLEWYGVCKSRGAKKVFTVCLDLCSECEPQLAETIKTRKFELFNSEWLAAVRSSAAHGGVGGGGGRGLLRYEAASPAEEEEEDSTAETPSPGRSSEEARAPRQPRRAAGDVSPKKALSRSSSPTAAAAATSSSSRDPSPRKAKAGSMPASPSASPSLGHRTLQGGRARPQRQVAGLAAPAPVRPPEADLTVQDF